MNHLTVHMKTGELLLITGLLFLGSCSNPHGEKTDWPSYGGNKQGNRYSSLRQINLTNVQDLQVAWIYNSTDTAHTGAGIICSIGRNKEEVWRAIAESRAGIRKMTRFPGETFPTDLF